MKTKKHLLSLLMIIFIAFGSYAQSPEGFNYQAIARDNSGFLLKNKSIMVKAVILSGPTASMNVYEETHSVTTNDFGQFSLVVGSGTSSGNFSDITWGTDVHSLKVEIDQGQGYVVMGTVQLQSVPYALHSKTAETAESVTNISIASNDLTDVESSGATNGDALKWDGSKWVPAPDKEGTTVTAGSGIDITAGEVSAKSGDAMWNANKLQGKDIENKAPQTGEILKWDGSNWKLSADDSRMYYPGMGLSLSNDTFNALNNNAMWNANRLHGVAVNPGAPAKNQVLQYNGTNWGFGTMTPALKSPWDTTTTGNHTYFMKGGNVGINTKNPASRLAVRDSLTTTSAGTVFLVENYLYGGKNSTSSYYTNRNVVIGQGGIYNVASVNQSAGTTASGGENNGIVAYAGGGGGSYNTGIYAYTGGSASGQSIGVFGSAPSFSTFNVGVYGQSSTSGTTGGNYGLYGYAQGGANSYAGYFSGNVTYTGTLAAASDAKLKYDINNIESATETIKKLRPTTYYFKKDGDAGLMNLAAGKQYGFIAQELEQVLPELVTNQVQMKGPKEAGQIEYKAVNYMALIPVLTQALKEQQATIEALEKRIESLENKDK